MITLSVALLCACAGDGAKPHYCEQGILSTAANQIFNPELFGVMLVVRTAMEPWCIDAPDRGRAPDGSGRRIDR
ncbi:MAG TPA: hypothetical protein VGB88_01600 [Alphaproteobacteria bacterium]